MTTHIIIQARMGSGRLPGKVMKDLCGHPMIYHVIERCRKSDFSDDVILATTNNAQDGVLAEFFEENNISFFRGDEEDVLKRYYETALKFGSGNIVRVTADCPLIDPLIIDKCIQEFNKFAGMDYLSNIGARTFPRGLDVEVFTFDALERAYKNAEQKYEREHVTPYIWENKKGEFNIGKSLEADASYRRDYRLTVDYPEDFELISEIYKSLYKENDIIDARDAIKFLDENPEMLNINADCKQREIK